MASGAEPHWASFEFLEHLGFGAADKRADSRFALHRSLGCQPEHHCCAILGFSRSGTEQFASADTIIGTEFSLVRPDRPRDASQFQTVNPFA
jgi:hypothetical protein